SRVSRRSCARPSYTNIDRSYRAIPARPRIEIAVHIFIGRCCRLVLLPGEPHEQLGVLPFTSPLDPQGSVPLVVTAGSRAAQASCNIHSKKAGVAMLLVQPAKVFSRHPIGQPPISAVASPQSGHAHAVRLYVGPQAHRPVA